MANAREKFGKYAVARRDLARRIQANLSFQMLPKEIFEVYEVLVEEIVNTIVEKGYWRHTKLGIIKLRFAKHGASFALCASHPAKGKLHKALDNPKTREHLDQLYDGKVMRYLKTFRPQVLDATTDKLEK